MAWHVLSSTWFDFGAFAEDNAADRSPRHLLPVIADRLGAVIHQPKPGDTGGVLERLGARVYGQPQHWSQARRVLKSLESGDAVYAAGCDSGVPLALLSVFSRRKVSFAIAVADVTRVRTKFMLRFLMLVRVRLLLAVTTSHQAAAAEPWAGGQGGTGPIWRGRAAVIHVIHGQTDTDFFRPRSNREVNEPPLVASCGVEQRDYNTLCAAMEEVKAEALVCFASPNQSAKTRYTKPDHPPDNVEFRYLPFSELRDLYRDADVVAIPLLHNHYSAGLTALFEAMACGAPAVASRTPGLISSLIDEDLLLGAPSGDVRGFRDAIQSILSDPDAAAIRAERARQAIQERFSGTAFVDRLEASLSRFAQPS